MDGFGSKLRAGLSEGMEASKDDWSVEGICDAVVEAGKRHEFSVNHLTQFSREVEELGMHCWVRSHGLRFALEDGMVVVDLVNGGCLHVYVCRRYRVCALVDTLLSAHLACTSICMMMVCNLCLFIHSRRMLYMWSCNSLACLTHAMLPVTY